MRCEVCGRKILGKPYKVIIEGARLTVCSDCAKHGKLAWEEEPKPKTVTKPKGAKPLLKVHVKRPPETPPATTLELVEEFDVEIRHAREKLGLSHEELGKKMNEKVSVLRKIETKKMTPDNQLATRLEHILKIKLIVPASEEKIKAPPLKMAKTASRELTLGDLIQLDKKDSKRKEDGAGREQS